MANVISNAKINQVIPELYGLVLAGGKSTRMGCDKGAMQWHGKEQKYYLADMLEVFCKSVFISCRREQQPDVDPAYKTLADNVDGSGPIIALMSAFRAYPDVAWLVVACDLPLLDNATLEHLIVNRDAHAVATTFSSPFDGLPEPLITIWEPSGHHLIESHFSEGFKCPRKALTRHINNVRLLQPIDPDALLNTNTPEDAKKVELIMNSGKNKYLIA